jgi:hypothetical protein
MSAPKKMPDSNLNRRVAEPFNYLDGQNLVGRSSDGNTWEAVYNGLTSLEIFNGAARTLTNTTVGAALRSANLPDKWANGFTVTFTLKSDSLTVGHNHFDMYFGANAPPGTQQAGVIFNSADINTSNLDILDNIHISNPSGPIVDQYFDLIPFAQNVAHQVVITFIPNSPSTTAGVMKVTIDGVERVSCNVDFAGVTDGIFLIYGFATTASRWTIDSLAISQNYSVGKPTSGGVALFPQGVGGFNRVLGYRTYDAPSTLAPTNHTPTFDLGTLADNLTLANPVDDGSGFAEGQRFLLLFKTSVGGNKTLAFGNKYKFGAAPVSAAALAAIVASVSVNVRVLFEYDSVLAAFVCTSIVSGF